MNPRKMLPVTIATVSLIFAVSCSSTKKEDKKDSQPKAVMADEQKTDAPKTDDQIAKDTQSKENAAECCAKNDEQMVKSREEAAAAISAAASVDQPTTVQTGPQTEQLDFASVEFDKGEAKLSEMDRRHLNELAMKMTGAGKVVDDIKILTWSDRTVQKDQEATNTEIILARQRAENIKRYLEKTLPSEEDIDFYNMAENPERYGSYMQRKGVPVEQAFNASGEKTSTDGRALVIIEYQSGPMPSQL